MSASRVLPTVSIVVPAFKAGDTIERTLISLFDQDYPQLEIIVMDGASDDGTVAILEKHSDKISFWTSEKDKCQADALNKGFARASGDIYGWLCADDTLAPNAISLLAGYLIDHPDIDVVTAGCKRIFSSGVVVTEPDEEFYDKMDYVNPIEQPSTLWRASAHHRAGALDLTYRYAFDWEFWCRLKRTNATFARLTEPVSEYYFSDDNLTSSGGRKIADEMYRVVKNYGPYNGRLADAYKFLFNTFDMNGFYDAETRAHIPKWRRTLFSLTLRCLYVLYDRKTINAYNWNFASRQERGLGWAS